MAVIDSKKLLPAGKPGGAITESQKPFLVPVSNILYKKDVNISPKLLKPGDTETRGPGGSLVVIKKKVLKIKDVIGNTYLIEQNENNRKRKEKERQKAEEREKRIETKPKSKVDSGALPKVSLPGRSILDTINRFLAFTLAGYLFDKYSQLLPKLAETLKYLEPVGKFIDAFAKNAVDGIIKFIDLGYKAYDGTRDFVKTFGGEGAAKTFDEFSSNLNKLLNGAIAVGMLVASTSPKGGMGSLGAGAAGAAAKAMRAKPISGFGGGTAMTPGRYRLPGQASAGGFPLEQARSKLTFEQSVAARKATQTAASQGAKGAARLGIARVPIIGALISFIIDTVVFKEKPSRAAAGAVGNAVGSGIGAVLLGSGTFGLGAGVGLFVGGFLGDIVGKSLYDAFAGQQREPTQARAEGGSVTSGQSRVAPTRRIKARRTPTRSVYTPPKVSPGKDIGGKIRIEDLYGKDEPGKRSALRVLKKGSETFSKVKGLQGALGGVAAVGINATLGQKPDAKLAAALGNAFGSVVAAAVNSELDSSFNDISRSIAMANGGTVPSRSINGGMSIGEKIGRYISNAFSIALQSSAASVLNMLNQELNLEGGPPGSVPDGPGSVPDGPGGGPLPQNQQEAFEKIRKIAEKVGSPNPSITAAIAMIESGWLANPNSIYFASGKTNPFGQSGRGPKGSVPGRKPGQRFAVYNNLEEGVKAHVDRWKSSYIGRTPEEIIENIRRGAGPGAPGMYNNEPGVNWTAKVLSAYRSGTQPQPSANRSGTQPQPSARGVKKFTRANITSLFGQQESFRSKPHEGMDIAAPQGTPISFDMGGEVLGVYRTNSGDRGANGGYGTYMDVKFSDGKIARIAHLSNIPSSIQTGKTFKANQIIAYSGGQEGAPGSGRSGGPHIHLEQLSKPMGIQETTKGKYDPLKGGLFQRIQSGGTQASIAPIQQSRKIASVQQNTSYTVVYDVNNIVMPIIA